MFVVRQRAPRVDGEMAGGRPPQKSQEYNCTCTIEARRMRADNIQAGQRLRHWSMVFCPRLVYILVLAEISADGHTVTHGDRILRRLLLILAKQTCSSAA